MPFRLFTALPNKGLRRPAALVTGCRLHRDTFRARWSSPLRSDDGERPLFVVFAVSATGAADGFTLDPGLFGEAVNARREPR